VSELELRSAAGLSDEELAELFTAGYEGYLVPMTITPETFRFFCRAYDLDREASLIALRDGSPVGLANLGLRGPDAWVGGIGVVPAERRRGTGRALMEALHSEAEARGVERIWLEVIVENAQAVALYEQLGYEHVRDLQVWTVPRTTGPDAVVPVAEARRGVAAGNVPREPWQRAAATVDNLDGVVGIATEGAAALVITTGRGVQLLQAAGTPQGLRDAVSAAASLGEPFVALNVDPADPLSDALASVGGRITTMQHELVLALRAEPHPRVRA
jgi:GNAT superfamily N-acetyltransferase